MHMRLREERERERERVSLIKRVEKRKSKRAERRERREKREIFEKSDREMGREREDTTRYFPRAFFVKEKRTKETSECIIIIIIIENTYPRGDVCVHPFCV